MTCPACARRADQVEALRAEVRQYRDALRVSYEWSAPAEMGLTWSQERLLSALVARERCSREALMLAVYRGREDAPTPKIIDVFVCKIRQRLKPFGLHVETIIGHGYQMPPADRARLRNWSRADANALAEASA